MTFKKLILDIVHAISIYLIIWGFYSFCVWVGTPVPEMTFSTDVIEDVDMSDCLDGQNIGSYEYHCKNSDPVVIIASHSDKVMEGYTKHEKALMSTIVLFVPNDVATLTAHSSGFANVSGSVFRTDLTQILTAMENEYTWQDIGISELVLKGPVSLIIPKRSSPYFEYVEETILSALNNFEPLSDDIRAELAPRLEFIINKCETVSDISLTITENYKSCEHVAFLGPEFLWRQSGVNYSYNGGFIPVYFDKQIVFYADTFVQDGLDDDFLYEIQTTSSFMSSVGWRVSDVTFSISDKLFRCLKADIEH